jgi:hypothetical protein
MRLFKTAALVKNVRGIIRIDVKSSQDLHTFGGVTCQAGLLGRLLLG